jgi:metallo-beta-lactamase family protein
MADVRITFNRGARRVTGSNFLVTVAEGKETARVLIDCGLSQSGDVCDPVNNEPFAYDPKEIDAVFFTHAHADHIGLYPKLTKAGFSGKAYATEPTADLMPVMLEDSVALLKTEAERCGNEPIYTAADLERAFKSLQKVRYHQVITVKGVRVTYLNAGHILGSATILVEAGGKKILFTGDLGRVPAALVPPRETYHGVDVLVTESVYGNRVHGSIDASIAKLKSAVLETVKKKGVLLIPAFSLERTQIILAALDRMIGTGELPAVPVYMDSPLAARVTTVYTRYPEYLSTELEERLRAGDNPFEFQSLRVTVNKEASSAIDAIAPPKVIIAGAGMSHGGRIRHHEKEYLGIPTTTLLLVGYQVAGSLGRRLRDGQKVIEIDRKKVKVRATVDVVDGFSAHADRDDLLKFAEDVSPKRAFVVLGETEAATFLAQRINGFLGIPVDVPREGEEYAI